ncbi:MAG: hypothetical protein ACQESE_04370 [Nanobdellota archaeon]
MNSPDQDQQLLIKKLYAHKCLTTDAGIYRIWGVPMLFLPYEVFSSIRKDFIGRFGNSFKEILYACGFLQAFNGTKILLNKFGINMDNKHFMKIFTGQTHMVGQGNTHFREFDVQNKRFLFENLNNPVAKEYKKEYGLSVYCIDDYMRGLTAGALSCLTDTRLVSIERECIAKGDRTCVFEIQPLNDFNDAEKILKTQNINESLVDFLLEKENLTKLLQK